MEIIDSHSHIGFDYLWGEANIDTYINLLKFQNISSALVMPTPGNVIVGTKNLRYFYWTFDKGKYIYNSDLSLKNPYKELNEYVYNKVNDKEVRDIKLYFIPLIHPVFDTPTHIKKTIERYNPVAIKFHGIAGGFWPEIVKSNVIEKLRYANLPIIIHTDYSHFPNVPIEKLRALNNPYNWANFIIRNKLKGYLTHGSRVDFKTFELVNNNDNLVIGIGPDLKISNERSRWVNYSSKEYLKILKDYVSHNKILFDIDYSWNVIGKEKKLDYNAVERVS